MRVTQPIASREVGSFFSLPIFDLNLAFLYGRRKGRYEFNNDELRGILEATFKLSEVAESCTDGAKNTGTGKNTGTSIGKTIGISIEADGEGAEGASNGEGVGIDAKTGTDGNGKLDDSLDGVSDGTPDGLANDDGHAINVKTGTDGDGDGKLDNSLNGVSDGIPDSLANGNGISITNTNGDGHAKGRFLE